LNAAAPRNAIRLKNLGAQQVKISGTSLISLALLAWLAALDDFRSGSRSGAPSSAELKPGFEQPRIVVNKSRVGVDDA
jgi:hypothetical protein